MSSDHWQQAKDALAEALALQGDDRDNFLASLAERSPEVHEEVVSLIKNQEAAEAEGFLGHSAETMDQYRTETYDPDRTRQPITTDHLGAVEKSRKTPLKDLVGPDYELEEKIGQGGMGVVYKAYHRSLRRTVALKIITGGGLRDEVDIARFHIEAEAAARLDHPGIIPVYDVGEHNGNHFYAMAYVEGPCLSKFVGGQGKLLPPRRAAELMEQICRAVQYAHDRAVIHRDLKPANVMLENGEIPRLADFGLAKNMHEDEGLTMTGQVMGTPSYMAPEQATGKLDEISNRTDVYSLGATLYALLAGKPPFSGGTMLETIRQVVRKDPEPLTQIVHSIPRDLQTICEKCLAKSPPDRYESADAVADDLRRFLDGYPISARPLASWARGIRWCQRNPVEAALLAVTAGALIVGTIVSVRYGLEANRQALAAQQSLAEARANAQKLRESIDESIVYASEDVLAQQPGMQKARAVLLETAQKYYAELVAQTSRDEASKRALGEAQFMLSKVQMALGQDNEASETLSRALATQESIVQRTPNTAAALTALAKTHNQLARLLQKGWQKTTQLRAMGKLTDEQAIASEEQLDLWEQHAAEVTRLRKRVVDLQPEDLESQRLLAEAAMNEGAALATRGYVHRELAGQDKARRLMVEAQEIRNAALASHPNAVKMRRALARGYLNMANVELRASEQEAGEVPVFARLDQSVRDLTQAIEAYQQLPSSELVLNVALEHANCYRLRADTFFQLVNQDSALSDYQQAQKLYGRLANRNPTVYRYRLRLAETQYNFSTFFFKFKKYDQAIRQFAKCCASLTQTVRIDPSNLSAIDQLIRFAQGLVDGLLDGKQFDIAELVLQDAIQELLALQEESDEYHTLGGSIELLRGEIQRVQELREQAETPDDVT